MHWYYADGDQSVGPVSEESFQALIKNKKIKSKTLVWHSGMSDWEPYGKVRKHSPVMKNEPEEDAANVSGELHCSECGGEFPSDDMIHYGDSWICAECKPAFVQKIREGVTPNGAVEYGKFWTRFGAKLIDNILLGIINALIAFSMDILMAAFPEASIVPLIVIQILVAFGYTTLFLGKYGATPGKMACKLKVITADGGKVSYLRAFGRCFGEILSGIILSVGYLIAVFDKEKRTLHDRICGTRVIRA
ncbi:MAG: hypothetical protein B6245_13535 [Desulfobacteraceae bacterium 4572_88]|nr:MAG: hypothetical protein B6245_13535 [Desulfobacteraceae bacterium 4572_88]